MTSVAGEWWRSVLHMIYPHLCKGCAADLARREQSLCAVCLAALPLTGFEKHAGNPAEKIFFGRIPIISAMSLLYFTQDSLVRSIVHQIKYDDARSLAIFMGRMMGQAMVSGGRFREAELLVPLPLSPGREKQRGYNQSALLAEGMAQVTGLPVAPRALARKSQDGTQTHRSREERWLQMHAQFVCPNPLALEGRSLVLVDDVITTGATLDACAAVLQAIPGVKTSITTLAIALK